MEPMVRLPRCVVENLQMEIKDGGRTRAPRADKGGRPFDQTGEGNGGREPLLSVAPDPLQDCGRVRGSWPFRGRALDGGAGAPRYRCRAATRASMPPVDIRLYP